MTKNYYYDRIWKRYRVAKTVKGRKMSYGTYATEEEAQLVVGELKKCGWDISQLPGILERLNIQSKSEREY